MSTVKVEMIQASRCSSTGQVIFTLVCEYPRVVHSQLLTHRVFSKNSSSSRAVPIKTAIEQLRTNPAKYVWTLNQAGMQGEVLTGENDIRIVEELMTTYREQAIMNTEQLANFGIHKQNAGRLLEPYQNIKIVLTSTEWENWDWLRIDGAAQGEIKELAEAIYEARMNAEILNLEDGEWHVPFVDRKVSEGGTTIKYFMPDTGEEISTEEAVQVSMSVCAQTSYRKLDCSLEKAKRINDVLFNGSKVHASPSEHQATPIPLFNKNDGRYCRWPKGITHVSRDHSYWSGNFRNFIQNRQLLSNHDKALF